MVEHQQQICKVFLDEVNTSSCMGLFKEIIIDKTFEGEPLPPNIFLVAACNPHRGNSLAVHENKEEHKAETWVRGSYYVQKLHPTLQFLMWDYGSLSDEQEAAYVQSKMIMVNEDFDIVQNVVFSELVVKCQNLIRQFANEQLKRFGIEDSEAKLRAASCVSQRDIQRVFTFYGWISKTYEMLQVPNVEGVFTNTIGDMPVAYITKHPMINERLSTEEMRQRALLVALGLVYYMRLDSDYRKMFSEELDKMHFSVNFLTAFNQEMDFYTNELSLPTGIAKTEALKENLFATIICTVTKTPLIIVGAPGSSKTLSFNLTISNLKGPESKQKLFRNIDIFKSLDPHYYQCSRRTTSTEIETVFQRAINRQRSHKSFSMPIRCVVFMDEAGLPEESHESLKVLHYHLDQQEVAFVAITNHILDAAKTNRAVSLFRPTASQEDLETLAKGCLCANPEKPSPELEGDLRTIVKFCPVYYAIMKDKCFEKFFGLRDFIHFINYIRRERIGDISPQLVLKSLERNFNGTTEGFERICSMFLEKVGATLDGLKQRSIIEILQSSLADKPYAHHQLHRTASKVISPPTSHDDTQNEIRYKLIIDPSEDESITRLLFMFDILKREHTRTFMCSDFLGDGQLQKINTIAAIRHSAIAGHTVIMSQTDDIHESFYDLFNQHFRRIDDPERGPRYFTNIAIGAHLKPSRVDQDFQCIVVVKESEVKNTPAPFLNRFEKYYISHTNLLNLVLGALPPCLKVIVTVVHKKVGAFYSLLDENSFYGGNKETVCSLLLSILPRPAHKYKPVTQSVVAIDSEVDQIDSSFCIITEGSSNKLLLLQNVVKCLQDFGGFCYMESSMEELEHDANCIIDLLAKAGSEFSGVAETLESCDVSKISQWITEAIDLIYTGEAPPDVDIADYDTCDENDEVKPLGASDGACMVTAVIAQWLVRYMCKKLMQLMTPEAAILKRKSIPISYLETYLNYQTHFSIKELINAQSKLLNQCGNGKVATKLICYTRSTPSIHQLPAMYPKAALPSAEQPSNDLVEDLICDKADNLFLCKLSSISSQTAFKLQLQAFEASQQQTVFVLVINMQDTSRLIINHIRIMIEEAEHTKSGVKKLFILLLHFPAPMFYEPCYPSLFLYGWDHYYLDAIDRANKSVLVDTREWFRLSCLSRKEASSPITADESMFQPLLTLLSKQESILVIASRILLNIDPNKVSLDSSPSIITKANYLKKLLFDKEVANILCLKFRSYWKPSVMGDHLEQAAMFSKSRESTLNVSDSVDSICRSSFFNFVAYMICQMSKGRNLDILLSDSCDDAVFLKLFNVYPIPKLSEIKAFNNTWDCRFHTAGRTGYIPQFPFFMEVSSYICKMLEQSLAEINKSDDVLQEKGSSVAVGLQSKEQMLKNLYEHLCDKMLAIMKADKTDGEKFMSAIAIKEMKNNELLWEKYFNDFTQHYLHLSTTAPNSLEHKLVQLTFTDVLANYNVMKAIAVHCYMHLYQLDLAKVIVSLKPLGQLEVLKVEEQSMYPGDPECTLVAALKSAWGSSSISKFVVDSLFAVLINAIYSKERDKRSSLLQKWFCSYRDMMSVASIRSMLPVATMTEQLKTQYHLMEMIFLILQSFHQITNDAAECAYTLACYFCTKCFDEKFQFKGDVTLNLNQIVSSFHVMLQSPQFAAVVSMPQLYQHVMEGLFTHFFPEISDRTAVYSKEDIEFFLTFANEQNNWKEAVYQNNNLISLSKFKFHLDRILCKGWSKNGASAKPLTFYKSEICMCVGEIILRQSPDVSLNEYVPLYLNKATPDDQPMLVHLYFYTVLEKLQTCQFTPTHLVKMVTDTEKKFSEVTNDAEKLTAVVEKQAITEALLQAVANNLEIDDKSKLSTLSTISDQLNELVKDASHRDILLMYLMKKYHGPQGILNLLAEKHKKFWEPLNCLKLIKEELKGSPPSTSHQFPFIVGSPTVELQFSNIYREICSLLNGVEEGSSTEKAKNVLKSIINDDDASYDGKSTVRMMIWLFVYYEFYCKKKQSAKLMTFFKEVEGDLGLSTERLCILNCFLDPKKMLRVEEAPNPLNPNAEVLEYKDGRIKAKQPPSNVPKRDAIWEFFNPRAREDSSDVDLRHALANLIAVVFGLPSRSTHLWYHLFNPRDLEDSYLTGFMYPKVVKGGTLMYDCGCELNEDGNYGRPDYNSRDSFSLHSWYLLLWCNFGAFCVGLLTQPTALEQLKGHILSDWMSIRDYCMTQLRTIWLHMRSNMSLGDEERSFFIMSSMYQLFMLFQKDSFPHPQGKFTELSTLISYEKAWHKLVYEVSKTDLKNKLENHSSHSVWALPALKRFRMLEHHYPLLATENDYMRSLVDATEANDCSYTHLFALRQFTLEQKRLQVGGALLPDLIEFYKWIHTQLSHLVTYQRAKQITIGNVISLTAKRYSQQLCDHLTKLFKRVTSKYNDYLRISGGVVGNVACNRVVKSTDVHYISKDTLLIHLVSLENVNKNDWLYIVLMDVIENHNAFLNRIFTHAMPSDCHYKKYLPDNPPELHPTEVSSQACIVPLDGSEGKLFLKLINSHYIYNGRQSTLVFDLDHLEQDVVKFFIAGKPLIAIDSSIRTVFRFRNSPTENILQGSNPGCAIDLSAIAQELPNDYKEPLRDEAKKALEFHFRLASYHTFTEVVDGLRTVMGHLIQDILQREHRGQDRTLNIKLFDYLKKLFSKDHRVFDEIGIQSINDTQRKYLGDIEMKKLFKCLGLFVGWLQGGLYDFNSLPISLFKHLNHGDLDTIMKAHTKYSSTRMSDLLAELDDFEKSLNHAEHHLIKEDHKASIIEYLVNLSLCDSNKFVSLIPESVLVCHYVHFRMTLRKLKIKVTALTQSQSSIVVEKWTEIIEDLWKHLSHFQDDEELYDDHCLKFDCVALQFGDGEDSDSDSETWLHQNSSDMEDSYEIGHKTEDFIKKIKENPELQKAVIETLAVNVAPDPTHNPASLSVIPSISPSSIAPPSAKAMKMNTEELCHWLKEKGVADKYIESFRKEKVDGSELATYDDDDLQDLGISEQRIRKKIMVQFRKIT